VTKLTLALPLRPTTFIGTGSFVCIVRLKLAAKPVCFEFYLAGLPIPFCKRYADTKMAAEKKTIFYKRSRFVTHLPADFLYSPSHYWMAQVEKGVWRIGLTKFATRMLGEMVDHGFDVEMDAAIKPGQIIGWMEGFKAIADVYCIGAGQFAGNNPVLKEKIALVCDDPYRSGWLYALRGKPDDNCVDVNGYKAILDRAIDKILEKQQAE
jgi:glycine cleavage system H protein